MALYRISGRLHTVSTHQFTIRADSEAEALTIAGNILDGWAPPDDTTLVEHSDQEDTDSDVWCDEEPEDEEG